MSFKDILDKVKEFWGKMPSDEVIPVEVMSQEFTQKEKENLPCNLRAQVL